jgi:anaerobic carbon-monoxide dehydrogenase iron sulfur subunit
MSLSYQENKMADKIETYPEHCRECQVCTLACSLYHEQECNLQRARLTVTKDMARYQFTITICQQCETPACLAACPAEAMNRDARGVVRILQENCIQCGACAEACPFQAIMHDPVADHYYKCDLCAGRAGEPLCVALCPVGALRLEGGATRLEGGAR